MSRVPRIFWLLLIIGIALRFAAIYLREPGVLERAPDEDEYYLIGKSIASGDGFALRGVTTAYRDMLLPVVAAGSVAVFGDTPRPLQFLNVLLSCASAWLLFRIGRRRFGDKIGLGMAAAWLFYPVAILFCAMLFTETLFVFWWLLALVLYDRLEERHFDLKIAFALGLVLGLLMLTRAVGQLFFAAVLIYIALVRFEDPLRLRWRAAILIFVTGSMVILPWLVRNALAVGAFTLNTNGGINLFIGNNPDANGSYKFTPEMEGSLPQKGEAAISRAAADRARDYALSHPRETIRLWGRKFAFLWATDAIQWVHYNPPEGPPSVSARLRVLPVWQLLLISVPYMLLVGLGISGYYLVRHFDGRGLFLLSTALAIAASMAAFGSQRFHVPLMPAMIVGAGALVRPKVWNSTPQWRRLFLLFTLGVFLGIWLLEATAIAGYQD